MTALTYVSQNHNASSAILDEVLNPSISRSSEQLANKRASTSAVEESLALLAGDKGEALKLVPSKNPSLVAAVGQLEATPTGAKIVDWLVSNGWRVGVPPSLSVGGTIDFANRIVLIEHGMTQHSKEVVAGVLAHEAFHAMRYAQTGYNRDLWENNFGKQEEFAGLVLQGKVTLEAEKKPVSVDAALTRIARAFQLNSYSDLVRQKYSHVPHNPRDTSFSDLEKRGLVPPGWSRVIDQRYREVAAQL